MFGPISVIVEREKADERRCLKHVLTIKGKEFTKTGVFAKLRKDFYGEPTQASCIAIELVLALSAHVQALGKHFLGPGSAC
jgi:hypothetical protein